MSNEKNSMKADVSDVLKQLQGMGMDMNNISPVPRGTVIREVDVKSLPLADQAKFQERKIWEEKQKEKHDPKPQGGGIPTIYPMSYQEKTQIFEELPPQRGWEEAMSDGKIGTFDPELNNMALEEVAKSHGLTVEQLLALKGKKLDNNVKEDTQMQEYSKEEQLLKQKISELQEQINALTQQTQEISFKKPIQPQQPSFTTAEVSLTKKPAPKVMQKLHATNTDILHQKAKNPVLEKLRKSLSLEVVKPEVVTVQDLTFELLPPVGSIQPWILQKVRNIAEVYGGDEIIMANVMKNVTFAVSVSRIEGYPAAQALGLVDENRVLDIYNMPQEILEITAQALWEMAAGTSTSGLPKILPEAVNKIVDAYNKRFAQNLLTSSNDPEAHRYSCEVPGCEIFLDKAPGGVYFCEEHGLELKDLGPLSELQAIPLA